MKVQKALNILQLIRAPAGFTALSNILAASILASLNQVTVAVSWLMLASLCFYFSGMALNDCFDYQEDLQQRPKRPLPSGSLTLNFGWRIGFGLMLLGLIFSFSYSLTAGFVGIALAASIVLYNGYIKQGLLGSICMGGCRYINWLLGSSFIGLSIFSFTVAIPILCYITGLTYLSKQETNGKDKSAVVVCATLLLLCSLSMFYLVEFQFNLSQLERYTALALITTWSLLMTIKLVAVFKDFTAQNIGKLITWMVIGVIPLDALIVAISGEYIVSLMILALLPPCRMLNRHLYVT